jgi:hypothetical protein
MINHEANATNALIRSYQVLLARQALLQAGLSDVGVAFQSGTRLVVFARIIGST